MMIDKILNILAHQELIEQLADVEHARWSKWQDYLFSICIENSDGSMTIPSQFVKHWKRQIRTSYKELSEKEKNSDRKEASNTLNILRSYFNLKRKKIQIVKRHLIPYCITRP